MAPIRASKGRVRWFVLLPLNHLFHFARSKAPRADANAADFSLEAHLHALNIRRPTTVGDVVRMANIVAERRCFRADFTFPSHISSPVMKK